MALRAGDSVRLSWPELEGIVGTLPPSASRHRAWWSGDRPHVGVWRSAGFAVADLDLGRSVGHLQPGRCSAAGRRAADFRGRRHRPGDVHQVQVGSSRARSRPLHLVYISSLFRKSRVYAERSGRPWFVLSAEYGLVAPDQLIAPYERYLPAAPASCRAAWGRWVVERLDLLAGPLAGRVVEIHAAAAYVDAVAEHLVSKGAQVVDPLHGLAQGERLAWYGTDEPVSPDAELVSQLLDGDAAVGPAAFLATAGTGLKVPGLCSWWVDSAGAEDLSRGLVEAELIYAGPAGATRWPSGARSRNTLWSRIAGMHLGGNHEFSTFRQAFRTP